MSEHVECIRYACQNAMIGKFGQDNALAALDALVSDMEELKDNCGNLYTAMTEERSRADSAEAERDAMRERYDAKYINWKGAAAERDRLREALGLIAHGVHDDATYDVLECALIARNALDGSEGSITMQSGEVPS